MSAKKQGTLLKYCVCDIEKPMCTSLNEKRKKQILITGFVFAFLLLAALCGFIQYTLVRLNNIEDEFRRVDHSLKKMLLSYNPNDGTRVTVPLEHLLEDDSAERDYEDVYQDYFEYDKQKPELSIKQDYEPATNFTKDLKQVHEPDSDESLEDDSDEDKKLNKRSIVAATRDGVLINSESYAEIKAKNFSQETKDYRGMSISAMPAKPSAFGYRLPYSERSVGEIDAETEAEVIKVTEVATKKPSVAVRRSRVMHTEDSSKAFRQILRRPLLKSGDMEYDSFQSEELASTETPLTSSSGKPRRLGRSRPLISVQYNGDTSKYVLGKHENFRGNGQLRHTQKNFVDWVPSDWVKKTGMDAHFSMNQGVVTVKDSGLYLIYAQIYYLDEHDRTGFRMYKNNNMMLQCTITQHTEERLSKGNTCYTSGVEFFSAGDTMHLSDITPGKYSLFEPGKSFFGMIKLGDFKNKNL